jgi:hypothetical protein
MKKEKGKRMRQQTKKEIESKITIIEYKQLNNFMEKSLLLINDIEREQN